jgi:microcystin degradation protein MlrC
VLVGTLFMESDSFATGTTTLAGFETAGLMVGGDLRRDRLPPGLELAAAWDALAGAGLEIVPGLFAWAPPGPPVRAADFEALAAELVERSDTALDGVYLQLHGSMLAEGIGDPEGLLLTRIRQRVGPAVPIAVSFDCHATMSRAIAGAADIVTAYRTCPHLDMARTGRQAGLLLARAVAGSVHPVVAWAPLAMITPPGRHDNDFPPFAAMMGTCDDVEQRPGILAAAMLPSQPWLDVPDLGWSAVVTVDGDRLLAEQAAREIALGAWERRAAFLTGPRMAVAEALDIALGGPAPYVVADAGDATNGGSTGDSTELLRAALSHQDRRIWLTVTDVDASRALRALALGTETTVTLGSGPTGTYNQAITVVGRVLAHPAGPFVYSHPYSRGLAGDLGTSAVLGIGELRVVVHARPVGLIDAEPYVGAGLDPSAAEVLQAKSHISYRTGFAPLTDRSIVADTPGPTTADLATLPWRNRPRPLWPLEDPSTPWREAPQPDGDDRGSPIAG